jgi:tRNA(Ile)-lysidine synthase
LETLDKSAKASILQTMENLQNLETQSLQNLETLQDCGFSATQIRSVQKIIDKQSGKQFFSKTHRATTHNGQLLIETINKSANSESVNYKIDIINIENFTLNTDPNIAQLDFDKLRFPLTLRHWKQGDFFVPFGQSGKQKLSDFFVNQKLSRFEKERVWLLCSGENIVWIMGYRIDNRYKISTKTKRVLLIQT